MREGAPNENPPAVVFCSECGTKNDRAAKFCKSCGKPLTIGPRLEAAAVQPAPLTPDALPAFVPPVSSFTGPISELIAQRMLGPPPRPGLLAVLDQFEILRVLGGGGMGIVLLARDSGTAREVAIKLIKSDLVTNQHVLHRFLKEAGHLKRLRHTNVVPVQEISDRAEGPYFVMPYFEKGSLANRIKPGQPLDSESILDFAIQVAEGLSFAHRSGIIHRDLKPANILLGAHGQVCLADFGLARTMFNDTIVDVESRHLEGTAPYMSPAVAAGDAEDTRCDIYSFGALLYEMLTGQPPYKGRGPKEILDQILAGPPKPITSLNPAADRNLVAVAEGCMARELRDRYADMRDVLKDLHFIKEAKPPIGPRGAVRKLRKRLLRISGTSIQVRISLVTACLAGLAVLIWLLWPGHHPTLLTLSGIYQTGFEPATFSPGTINGQDGWWIAGGAPSQTFIGNTVVKSGLQAVGITPSGSSGIVGAGHSASQYNAANRILTFSVDALFSATGTPSFWTAIDTVYVYSGSASHNIDLNIDPSGQIHVFIEGTDYPTRVSVTRGVWNHYELDVNFINNTVSAFYNVTPLVQNVSFSPPSKMLDFDAFYAQGAGTDTGYFDNLSVTASGQTVQGSPSTSDSITLFPACVNGLQVDVNGVYSGNHATNVIWDWGDGQPPPSIYFPESHKYAAPGQYTIKITAYYSDGTSASASQTVDVSPGILSGCYALTIAAGNGGSVSYQSDVGSGLVAPGSSVTIQQAPQVGADLTANPSSSFSFTNWSPSSSLSGCPQGAPIQTTSVSCCVIVNADSQRITANFPPVSQSTARSSAAKYATNATPNQSSLGITTLAGQVGVAGFRDGVGTQAQFRLPNSVTLDSAGNVYVADTANNVIRKITSNGVISTLAGLSGSHGSADGTGSSARFWAPFGIGVDSDGNIYVADTANNTIRKVTPDGVVSTLAGLAGHPGSKDGIGIYARFRNPWGVAVDGEGDVYVADMSNDTIRKITPAGVVTTLAGQAGMSGQANGFGSNARFNGPFAVAVDNAENVYVSDSGNNTIRKIMPGREVGTLAGFPGYAGNADGGGNAARFCNPQGLSVDGAGNIYVADTGNNTIRKITPTGVVTTLLESAGNNGRDVRLNSPSGVVVDSEGNIYVADTDNHCIRKIAFPNSKSLRK